MPRRNRKSNTMKIIFSFLILLITANLTFGQDALKTSLEASYKKFYDALKAKDGEKLKASMSAHNYMKTRNAVTGAGQKFPDALYNYAEMAKVDFTKLKVVQVQEKGNTAKAVYYGKGAMDDDNSFLIFSFLKENNEWKVDGVLSEYSEELDKKYKKKDLSFLKEDMFTPSGVMPEVPKEIVPGDYQAMLDIMSYGYKVEVKVNGNVQDVPEAGSYSGVILGGIKKGKNTIEIKVTPKEGDSKSFSVGIRALINGEEKDVYKNDDENPKTLIVQEFEVN